MSFEYFMKYKNKYLALGGGELDIEYHTDDYNILAKSYKRAYQLSKQHVGGAGAKAKAGAKKDEGDIDLKTLSAEPKVKDALKAVSTAAAKASPQIAAISTSVKSAVESASKPDSFDKVVTELDKLKKVVEAADKKAKEAADKNKKEMADINKFIKDVKAAAATCKGCDKYTDGKKYDEAVKLLKEVAKIKEVK